MTTNIKTLAEKLGLSTSTISRAFRNKSDISEATKVRILAMAKELNYQPNPFASNLRDKTTKTIAVIVPQLANDFFSKVIDGIEKITSAKDYHILVYVTGDDYEKEVAIINHLHSGRVDGIVMSVSGEGKDHTYLNNFGERTLPMVFFDRVYEDIEVPKVTTDDFDSSFQATEYLIHLGCKKIACLVRNKELSIGKDRAQGYLAALKKNKIKINENLIVDCSNELSYNVGKIKETLQILRPDALFATVERLAFASYYACNELNIHIPQDLKILSFSSLDLAPLLSPALTTIVQPAHKMGETAAQLLFQLLDKTKEEIDLGIQQQTVLKSVLIPRTSTS